MNIKKAAAVASGITKAGLLAIAVIAIFNGEYDHVSAILLILIFGELYDINRAIKNAENG